jgi:methylenetetrahydrofolate dehydrogenase (NADP+)/methenyltetrahydrofolate cyclohydrolase
MTAKILDGKKLADEILPQLKKRVEKLRLAGVVPKIDVILVGDDEASQIYVRKKLRSSESIGMRAELHRFPAEAEKEKIIATIRKLNEDDRVHAILVQLPLPGHLEEQLILDKISPEKDVDGLTTRSLGRLVSGHAVFEPCTPKGIMKLFESENIQLEGKNAVVIGRSNIVGKPAALMLMNRNATVTICHSKTRNLAEHARGGDILVAAVGMPNFVKADFVKDDAIVIDVGTNRVNGKVVGDVDFGKVKAKAGYITPVPGGVGPLTVAMVLENTIISAERRLQK